MQYISRIAFGGGCHWCTEAVFKSLIGVVELEQGFVASVGEASSFSEAVIVYFNPEIISLNILTEIHLLTHKSTSNHSMRKKYRSAVYVYPKEQHIKVHSILESFQRQFYLPIITKTLFFNRFKDTEDIFKNYYYNNPEKPFCKRYIEPKPQLLFKQFTTYSIPERRNY